MKTLFVPLALATALCACAASTPAPRHPSTSAPERRTVTVPELGISLEVEEGRWDVVRGCTERMDGTVVLENRALIASIGISAVPRSGEGMVELMTRMRSELLRTGASSFEARYTTDQFGRRAVVRYRETRGDETVAGRAAILMLEGREDRAYLVMGVWPELRDMRASELFAGILDGMRTL